MIEFHQTVMGRAFFDSTVPHIARSLERLAAAAERLAVASEEAPALIALDADGTVRLLEGFSEQLHPDQQRAVELACDILADLATSLRLTPAPGPEKEATDGRDSR